MARPLNIFLVRHAVSEANLDKSVNARLPDAKVPLAEEGHRQADAAGEFLAQYLLDPMRNKMGQADNVDGSWSPGKTRILCSPYMRTRETSAAIEKRLIEAGIAFDRREELALREISFGLFDGIADEELPNQFPLESAYYEKHKAFEGEFYAPMPLGESRVQVADRVKTVFGTILRDAEPFREDRVSNFIVVSHGVTIRAFVMQWLHRTPEWYQEQKNPGNASITLIGSDGRAYSDQLIFDGFRHERTKQEKREEGDVE